jgi:serine/threonine protein kinase
MPKLISGRYQCDSTVRRGGFGEVLFCQDMRTGQKVALKIARRPDESLQQTRTVEGVWRSVRREAEVLAVIEHKNIVRLLDQGEWESRPYIVLEYLPGLDLHDRSNQRLPLNDALDALNQATQAVRAVHRAGYLHLDIKPENFIRCPNGRVVLIDFGTACKTAEAVIPGPGDVVTLSYSSPEQMNPRLMTGKHLTEAADIFSLGAMAFELLTGLHPFGGDDLGVIQRVLEKAPKVDLAEYLPELPKPVAAVLKRALAKSPSSRPSADDITSRLNDWVATHQKAEAYVEADRLFAEGQIEQAAAVLQSYGDTHPDDLEVFQYLAEKLIPVIRAALATRQDLAAENLLIKLDASLLPKVQQQEIESLSKHVTELRSAQTNVPRLLKKCWEMRERRSFDHERHWLERARELDPDHPAIQDYECRVLSECLTEADNLWEQGSYQEAIDKLYQIETDYTALLERSEKAQRYLRNQVRLWSQSTLSTCQTLGRMQDQEQIRNFLWSVRSLLEKNPELSKDACKYLEEPKADPREDFVARVRQAVGEGNFLDAARALSEARSAYQGDLQWEQLGKELQAARDAVRERQAYISEQATQIRKLIVQGSCEIAAKALDEARRKQQEHPLWAELDAEIERASIQRRKAKQEAERKARQEAERKEREESERKAHEEAERKAREEAERKEREESERKAHEEAERKAREEAERKEREEAERKAREEAERKAHEEAERKAHEEAERKAREEAERKAHEEAERKAREEAERKTREEAEREEREEAERKTREEAERKAREEAERKAREEAERKAREEAERKAREEAERKAREEAERKAREEAERKAREEAERKAREEAERKARQEAERKGREEAERKAREEAERKAREEAERKARQEAERKAREEAERKAREEAERKPREEAERKAREEAERKARQEAERKEREEAERKAHEGAERKTREEAERKAREKAERKARQEAERKASKENADRAAARTIPAPRELEPTEEPVLQSHAPGSHKDRVVALPAPSRKKWVGVGVGIAAGLALFFATRPGPAPLLFRPAAMLAFDLSSSQDSAEQLMAELSPEYRWEVVNMPPFLAIREELQNQTKRVLAMPKPGTALPPGKQDHQLRFRATARDGKSVEATIAMTTIAPQPRVAVTEKKRSPVRLSPPQVVLNYVGSAGGDFSKSEHVRVSADRETIASLHTDTRDQWIKSSLRGADLTVDYNPTSELATGRHHGTLSLLDNSGTHRAELEVLLDVRRSAVAAGYYVWTGSLGPSASVVIGPGCTTSAPPPARIATCSQFMSRPSKVTAMIEESRTALLTTFEGSGENLRIVVKNTTDSVVGSFRVDVK